MTRFTAAMAPEKPPVSQGLASHEEGDRVSADQLEQLKRFREKYFPDVRVEAQDTYAKWLFALTTTVAALGSGFSNAAFAKLSSWGVLTYSVAVLAAGCGLMFAVSALSAEWPDANWASLDGMIAGFKTLLIKKRRRLTGATLCLGLSLILAAGAGLATSIQRQPSEEPSGIGVQFAERKLGPSITLSGLSPGAPAELQVFEKSSGKTILIGVFRQIADDDGQISYKGPELKISSEAEGLKLMLTYERRGKAVSDLTEFNFPAEPASPKNTPDKRGASDDGSGKKSSVPTNPLKQTQSP